MTKKKIDIQKEAEKELSKINQQMMKNKPKPKKRKPSGKKGRSKGDKNITSLGGGKYINQHGVEFSDSEREAIRQAVNSIKRKQKRILSDTSGKYDGLKTYLKNAKGDYTGILGDFTTSMNEYESRQAIENQLKRLERMRGRGYEIELMKRTKENYIKTIEPTFKHYDVEFINHLKKMPLNEFFNRRGNELTDDFFFFNSGFKDPEDMYISRMVHSFGWLTVEEQANNESAIDRYTGKPIPKKEKVKAKTKSKTPKKAKK